jgi:hypothetical protein
VFVESFNHPNYFAIQKHKKKIHRVWQSEKKEVAEDPEAVTIKKCALCAVETKTSEMDLIYIHPEHHKAFYTYAHRFRKRELKKQSDKTTGELTEDEENQSDAPDSAPADFSSGTENTEKPVTEEEHLKLVREHNALKRKHTALIASIRRWANADNKDETTRLIKGYVERLGPKKKKRNEDVSDSDM